MTSKRKLIIEALQKYGLSTMDDLGFHTGIIRKSLHDNVKAAVKDNLVERTIDDVTNQPAYQLTKAGRAWTEKAAKPQPTVGHNIGSDESVPIVDGGPVPEPSAEVITVIEPPKPDDSAPAAPAAVRSDETTGGIVRELQQRCTAYEQIIINLQEKLELAEKHLCDFAVMAVEHDETEPPRYIAAESYWACKTIEEANRIALTMAAALPIDTPVTVFETHRVRELRINWRDA